MTARDKAASSPGPSPPTCLPEGCSNQKEARCATAGAVKNVCSHTALTAGEKRGETSSHQRTTLVLYFLRP